MRGEPHILHQESETPAWPSERGRRTGIVAQFGESRAALLHRSLVTGDPLADAVSAAIHEEGRRVHTQLQQGLSEGLASLDDPHPAVAALLEHTEALPEYATDELLDTGSLAFFTMPAPTPMVSLSAGALIRAFIAPVGLGVILVMVVLGVTGRWQRVFVDERPLRRWTLVLPLLLLAACLIVMNYTGLSAMGMEFVLTLIVPTFIVGLGEELLFRGIGVDALRSTGMREVWVGLLSSVILGAVHFSNVFVTNVQDSLIQVVLTTGTGFLFYLIMRATGSIMAAVCAHALWDFAVFTTQLPAHPTGMAPVAMVALVVILLLVLFLRKKMAPTPNRWERAQGRR